MNHDFEKIHEGIKKHRKALKEIKSESKTHGEMFSALHEKMKNHTQHPGHSHGKILGTTTVGERGQVVIPAEAREEMDINPGDKFVVFGNKRKGAVILIKADLFNKVADIFLSKSKKLQKLAESIMSHTVGSDEENSEEKSHSTEEKNGVTDEE